MENHLLDTEVNIGNVEVTLNQEIVEDKIPLDRFKLFVQILKTNDIEAYKEERTDEFLDLYNYWNVRGFRAFSQKLYQNCVRFNLV